MFNLSIKHSGIPGGKAEMSFYPNLCAHKEQHWCFITQRDNRWIVVFGEGQTILIERILKLPFLGEKMPIDGIMISASGEMFAVRKDEKCFIWQWSGEMWAPAGIVPIQRQLLYSIDTAELQTKQDGMLYIYRPETVPQPYSVPMVKWKKTGQKDAGEF